MARCYWLIKSEPGTYPWSRFVEDGVTLWDGVRNFEARNNLRAMKLGDFALFYHSNEGKEFVGVARVVRTAYQDPTTEEDWSAVDFQVVRPLVRPLKLAEIRADAPLSNMALLKRSRLSVAPLTAPEFRRVLKLAQTSLD